MDFATKLGLFLALAGFVALFAPYGWKAIPRRVALGIALALALASVAVLLLWPSEGTPDVMVRFVWQSPLQIISEWLLMIILVGIILLVVGGIATVFGLAKPSMINVLVAICLTVFFAAMYILDRKLSEISSWMSRHIYFPVGVMLFFISRLLSVYFAIRDTNSS
jgi:hypothetical protein